MSLMIFKVNFALFYFQMYAHLKRQELRSWLVVRAQFWTFTYTCIHEYFLQATADYLE